MRFELSNFDVQARLTVREHPDQAAIEATVLLSVKDRTTGAPDSVTCRQRIDERVWKMMPAAARARWVHDVCIEALRHELDECFLVDGVRVLDPHKNEATDANGAPV